MSAAQVIDRLDRVLQTSASQWRARCPAHDGQSLTLSIRETNDGRVLLHCFAGCAALDILDSVGLSMSNLFPERPADHRFPPSRSRWPAAEILACIDHEVTVARIILGDVIAARTFDDEQLQRLTLAADRISDVRSMSCPARIGREVQHARA